MPNSPATARLQRRSLTLEGVPLDRNPMSNLPSPPSFESLVTSQDLALFLDFDGTLVELAATPDGIDVPRHLARSLHALSDRLGGRLALVSGRAIVDLEQHLGPMAIAKAGSHGGDCRGSGRQEHRRYTQRPPAGVAGPRGGIRETARIFAGGQAARRRPALSRRSLAGGGRRRICGSAWRQRAIWTSSAANA